MGSAVGCVLVFDAHGLVEFASWLLHWAVLFIFLGRGAFLSSMQMLQGTVGVVLLEGLGSIIASRSWGGVLCQGSGDSTLASARADVIQSEVLFRHRAKPSGSVWNPQSINS